MYECLMGVGVWVYLCVYLQQSNGGVGADGLLAGLEGHVDEALLRQHHAQLRERQVLDTQRDTWQRQHMNRHHPPV